MCVAARRLQHCLRGTPLKTTVESNLRRNRDRGEPRGSAPPTPPDVRVRITAVRRIMQAAVPRRKPGRASRSRRWQGNGERGAVAEPPRAMWAAGGLCRQVPADAAASQLGKASASALPLLPDDGAQPPPDPLVKRAQHRRGLAEAEVAAPADEVDGQLLDDLREAAPARAPRQFPDPCLEAGERLRRNAPPRFASRR